MPNFEAFRWSISSIINLFFLKSEFSRTIDRFMELTEETITSCLLTQKKWCYVRVPESQSRIHDLTFWVYFLIFQLNLLHIFGTYLYTILVEFCRKILHTWQWMKFSMYHIPSDIFKYSILFPWIKSDLITPLMKSYQKISEVLTNIKFQPTLNVLTSKMKSFSGTNKRWEKSQKRK